MDQNSSWWQNALNGGVSDFDGDNILNYQEWINGTNPNEADTDLDGNDDDNESVEKTNPLNPDTDGDGLSDSFELSAFIPPALVKPVTNPLLIDTDNDGLLDGEDDEPTTAGEGVFSGLVVKSIKYKDDKTTYFEELPQVHGMKQILRLQVNGLIKVRHM